MFEQTIIASRPGLDRRWFPIAALLHAGGLALILVAQSWRVGDVPSPLEDLVFVVWKAPAPPADEPPRPAIRPSQSPPPAPTHPIEPRPVAPAPLAVAMQPTAIPVDLPSVVEAEALAGFPAPGRDSSTFAPARDGPGSGSDFLPLTIGMTPPVVLHRIEPAYTEAARRARRQGIVILELHVGATGEVVAVEVVRPLGFGLDDEAVRAVRHWRFAPARLSGRPVGVIYTITVRYELT